MPNTERIKQVKNAIIEHLKTVGPRDWEEVQKDFLEIPMSSFWRYVHKAKEQLKKASVSEVAGDLFTSKEQPEGAAPSAPHHEVNAAFRALNHARRLADLHADLLALRQHALDADGRIVDTQLFAKTIRLRNDLLKDEQSILNSINAAEIQTKFIDDLGKALETVPPEVAKAAMAALYRYDQDSRGSDGGVSPA